MDGHNQSETFWVESNRPGTFFKNAHRRTDPTATDALNKILGFDIEELCSEYEDATIKASEYKKLYELGLIDQASFEYAEENEGVLDDIDCKLLLTIWLNGLQQLVDPAFEWQFIREAPDGTVNSHLGYGCFY